MKKLFLSASLGSIVAILCLGMVVVPLTGCTGQQTAAELITTAGNAVVVLERLEGNTADITKIQQDFTAASNAVMNWKSGSPTQDIVELLNTVQDDLNLLPISTADQALIDLAIGTVDQVLNLFSPAPTVVAEAGPHLYFVSYTGRSHVKHRKVHLEHPPKSKSDFKKQWNKIAKSNPQLNNATIN